MGKCPLRRPVGPERRHYQLVPEDVCKQGPWQGQHRGEIANLTTQYLLDVEEQGYVLVRCEAAVFKPEVWDSPNLPACCNLETACRGSRLTQAIEDD